MAKAMTKELVPVTTTPVAVSRQSWNSVSSFNEALALAEMVSKSNALPDVRNAGVAILKILAGQEMGFGPCASLVGVHIIEGKPSVGAHLQASAIRGSGVYDYKVIQLDRERCELEFVRKRESGWESLGKVSLTAQEAWDSGLSTTFNKSGEKVLKANWARGTDDMLFARCISKGFKRFCPDLTGGVVMYDPDELDNAVPVQASVMSASPAERFALPEPKVEPESNPMEFTMQEATEENADEEEDVFTTQSNAPLMASGDQISAIREYFSQLKLTDAAIAKALKARNVDSLEKLTSVQASEVMEALRKKAVALQTGKS